MFILESVGSYSQHFPEFRSNNELYYVPGSPELRWPLSDGKLVRDWPKHVCIIRTADGPLPDLPSLSVDWFVASNRLAKLLLRYADEEIESFPIAICDLFGRIESKKYAALNFVKPLASLDARKSIRCVSQNDPRGSETRRRIAVRSTKVKGRDVFCLKGQNLVIVSERIRKVIESKLITGCHFSEVVVS